MKPDVKPFPGVYQRADSNTYQFGLKAPKDLEHHFPGKPGAKWAMRCSLRTSDLREANDKAKALQAEWAERFAALRANKPAPVNVAAIRAKLLAYAEQRFLPALDRQVAAAAAPERAQRARAAMWARDDILQGIERGYVSDDAEDWLTKAPQIISVPHSPEVDALALQFYATLQELKHEAYTDRTGTLPLRVARIQAWREVVALDTATLVPPLAAPITAPAPAAGHRIDDALTQWKRMPRAVKTAGTFTRHAEQFATMMGDPVLATLGKPDAIRFRDKLQEWALTERKAAKTADGVLTSVRTLLNVARDQGWIVSNPLERVAVTVGGKASVGREPWTAEELAVLFDDPIWSAYQLPEGGKAGGDAAYWIPLIACYTGARVSEIAQLWTDDLTTTAGSEAIEFRANAGREQGLKNKASWRAVPMHSELIRLGLPEYVASLPLGPLFPALPKGGQNGPGGQFSYWYGRFKSDKGFKSPSKSFHSFRHLVASELRHRNVADALADAITGHAGKGIARTVYSATIRRDAERLRPVIELLQFPPLRRLPGVSPYKRRASA